MIRPFASIANSLRHLTPSDVRDMFLSFVVSLIGCFVLAVVLHLIAEAVRSYALPAHFV